MFNAKLTFTLENLFNTNIFASMCSLLCILYEFAVKCFSKIPRFTDPCLH
jgi:hypothetical protein